MPRLNFVQGKLLFLLLPLTLFAINIDYLSIIFPIYSGPPGYDQDPAYLYLFNGLLILDGQGPWQVDHPGTPLQFLCAAGILLARSIFWLKGDRPLSDLVDDVLSHPEPYLYIISIVILLLNTCGVLFLGRQVYAASQKRWVALLCQCGGLAFSIMSPRAAYVAPEALLILCTHVLVGSLAPVIFFQNVTPPALSRGRSVFVGVLCGFGLAVKLTFFPVLLLLLSIRSAKRIVETVCYSALSFFVLILPSYKNAPRLWDWLWGIATHSGLHGSGANKVIDVAQLWQNMRAVLSWFAPLYAVLALLLAYVGLAVFFAVKSTLVKRDSQRLGRDPLGGIEAFIVHYARIPAVFIATISLQTLLVLKHPGAHYLIPVLPIAFVGFAWLFERIETACDRRIVRSLTGYKFAISCASVLFAVASIYPTIRQIGVMRIQRHDQEVSLRMVQDALQQVSNPTVICAFRCTTEQYATALGLIYAPGLTSRPIVKTLLANYYEYNFLVRELIAPGHPSVGLAGIAERLVDGEKMYVITPKDYPELAVFKLQKITASPVLTLYKLEGVAARNQDKLP